MNIEKIKEHYDHEREKHPYSCDMVTCLSETGADTHLDIYRATLAASIATDSVEASTIMMCEHYEAIQAYTKGNISAAIEECYDNRRNSAIGGCVGGAAGSWQSGERRII